MGDDKCSRVTKIEVEKMAAYSKRHGGKFSEKMMADSAHRVSKACNIPVEDVTFRVKREQIPRGVKITEG
mgnify:CR=1 FL=1